MGRPYIRSAYRAGVVAWLDWALVAVLLVLGGASTLFADSLARRGYNRRGRRIRVRRHRGRAGSARRP